MQLVPPEVTDTPEAPKQAKEKLRQMGPMTRDELIMSFTMLGAVILGAVMFESIKKRGLAAVAKPR